MAAFAANDAFQKAEASGRHIRTKIVTLKDLLDVGQPRPADAPGRKQMNQSRSEYVVAIIWREKQISTLLCDRIHDDHIAAIPSKKRNKLPQICAPPTEGGVGRKKVVCPAS